VPLPGGLPALPHTVRLAAADGAGLGAYDRGAVFPTGWLPEDTARIVADAVDPPRSAITCRRFGAGRVDCQDETEDTCRMVSVHYARERVRWGAYRGCEPRAHPRYTRAPRPLRARDWHCRPRCRPALLGRVREADIVPQR
jgi:hypothetical protein